MLKSSTYWYVADGNVYLDGGSRSIALINEYGDAFHLHQHHTGGRVSWGFSYRDWIEVEPASTLETQLIDVLEEVEVRPLNLSPNWIPNILETLRDRSTPWREDVYQRTDSGEIELIENKPELEAAFGEE